MKQCKDPTVSSWLRLSASTGILHHGNTSRHQLALGFRLRLVHGSSGQPARTPSGPDEFVLGDVRQQMRDSQSQYDLNHEMRQATIENSRSHSARTRDFDDRGYGGEAAVYSPGESDEEILDDRSEQVDIGRSA